MTNKVDKNETLYKKHHLNPQYAKGFTIYENKTTIKLICRNPGDTTKIYATYFFDKKNEKNDWIKIPIQSACISSTTHSFLFDILDMNHIVKGMSGLHYIKDKKLISTYTTNKVMDIGSDDQINREKIVMIHPDILMVYPYDGADYGSYDKAKIPVIYNAEYLEQHPLGKAEWIKVVGLLTGKEHESHAFFQSLKTRYHNLCEYARTKVKPSVLLDKPIDNVWYIPGNNSFAVQLIKDAGGNYIFESEKGNNVHSKNIEWILENGSHSDYWVFTDYSQNKITLKTLDESNKSFKHLKSFKEKKVIVCNAFENDFFGKGVIEPDVLLEDLIHHFHGMDSSYQPVYFKLIQ